jgi:hypothetical protein
VAYSVLLSLAVLVLGILWGPVDRQSRQGVARYLAHTGAERPAPAPSSRMPAGGGPPRMPALPPPPPGGGPPPGAR